MVWKLACLVVLCVYLGGCASVRPVTLATPEAVERLEGIRWCGALWLPRTTPAGAPLGGISGLAWDEDRATLYAVSDRGRVHHWRPRFAAGRLVGVDLRASFPLRDRDGRPLRGEWVDAEGVALETSSARRRLWISFERHHRIAPYNTHGRLLGAPHVPQQVQDAGYNTGMEALAGAGRQRLVGLERGPRGHGTTTPLWLDPGGSAHAYPLAGETNSALTALASAGPGRYLALERAYTPLRPIVITLKSIRWRASEGIAVTSLARLSGGEGWHLDNFEGLTALGAGRYLMVSDDNFSTLQRTLLACFRVEADAGGPSGHAGTGRFDVGESPDQRGGVASGRRDAGGTGFDPPGFGAPR